MEPNAATEIRTMDYAHNYPFSEEFHTITMPPHHQSGGNSFTALLELPPNQALHLLQTDHLKRHRSSALAARAAEDPSYSLPVKCEPLDCNSADPTVEKETPLKRKETEKKGKGSGKKSKTTAYQKVAGGEELPYIHVRARRGQATDSHSLAERARREKINAKMKLLQEIVPGCNKISGTALVLEEIINHVHSLQRQVEYLSMRLAVVNPRPDFNLDSLISGNESAMDCSIPNMGMQLMWPEIQANGDKQLQQQWHFESLNQPVWVKEEVHQNLITSENSLLTYDSSSNSASLHSSRMKMQL